MRKFYFIKILHCLLFILCVSSLSACVKRMNNQENGGDKERDAVDVFVTINGLPNNAFTAITFTSSDSKIQPIVIDKRTNGINKNAHKIKKGKYTLSAKSVIVDSEEYIAMSQTVQIGENASDNKFVINFAAATAKLYISIIGLPNESKTSLLFTADSEGGDKEITDLKNGEKQGPYKMVVGSYSLKAEQVIVEEIPYAAVNIDESIDIVEGENTINITFKPQKAKVSITVSGIEDKKTTLYFKSIDEKDKDNIEFKDVAAGEHFYILKNGTYTLSAKNIDSEDASYIPNIINNIVVPSDKKYEIKFAKKIKKKLNIKTNGLNEGYILNIVAKDKFVNSDSKQITTDSASITITEGKYTLSPQKVVGYNQTDGKINKCFYADNQDIFISDKDLDVTLEFKSCNNTKEVMPGWGEYIKMGAFFDPSTKPESFTGTAIDTVYYSPSIAEYDSNPTIDMSIKDKIEYILKMKNKNGQDLIPIIGIVNAYKAGYDTILQKNLPHIFEKEYLVKSMLSLWANIRIIKATLSTHQKRDVYVVLNNSSLDNNIMRILINNYNDLKDIPVPIDDAKAVIDKILDSKNKWQWKGKIYGGSDDVILDGLSTETVIDGLFSGAYKAQIASNENINFFWKTAIDNIVNNVIKEMKHTNLSSNNKTINAWLTFNKDIYERAKIDNKNIHLGLYVNLQNSNAGNYDTKWVYDNTSADAYVKKAQDAFKSYGINSDSFDFVVFDKAITRDAIDGVGKQLYSLWNSNDIEKYLSAIYKISDDLPIMLINMPTGHLQTADGVDKRESDGSSETDYFFGDLQLKYDLTNLKPYYNNIKFNNDSIAQYLSPKQDKDDQNNWQLSHAQNIATNKRIFAIVWGNGVSKSVQALEDGGWLKTKLDDYYKNPAVFFTQASK